MYEAFYNLAVLPFHNTPDSRFFFETEQHREALAKLEYTVMNKRGFALVTGEIGSGKTTLVRTLMRRLNQDARVALVNNTRVNADQLLRLICDDLGINAPEDADKAKLLMLLKRFTLEQLDQNRRVVVVIDEGQCLGVDEFEEVRLLTNLETETEKLVQLLILGQPELKAKLMRPRLAPLIQRVVMYCHLKPLTFDEMTRYIAFRLVRASRGRPKVDLSRSALNLVYERSGGVPRVVNLICDNALLVGYANQTHFIDSKVVISAIGQMMPNFGGQTADEPLDEVPNLSTEEEADGRHLQGDAKIQADSWPGR